MKKLIKPMMLNQLRNSVFALALSATVLAVSGCASTTNQGAVGVDRQQLMLISSEQMLQISAQSYAKELQDARSKNVLDKDAAQLARLRRIAQKLIPVVSTYRSDAVNWNWEVHTIKSNSLNAFVLPGGKVMFHSGIIDRLELTDAEIAAIMGHEMAHALREHARERMSRSVATRMGIGIAASAFGLSQSQTQMAGLAGDLGLTRPHSRVQESEADVVGLELQARAGYNPQAAVTLWQKMRQAGAGRTPEFISTHPSGAHRIATLQSLMPKVIPLYQQALSGGVPSSTTSNQSSTTIDYKKFNKQ